MDNQFESDIWISNALFASYIPGDESLTAWWFFSLALIAHAVIMTACWFLFLALIADVVLLVEFKYKIKKYQYSCLCYKLI